MRRWGLLGSFGTIGDCFDNAVMESFWARMQVELLNTPRWATTIELAAAMADYIENFYNAERAAPWRLSKSLVNRSQTGPDLMPCSRRPIPWGMTNRESRSTVRTRS